MFVFLSPRRSLVYLWTRLHSNPYHGLPGCRYSHRDEDGSRPGRWSVRPQWEVPYVWNEREARPRFITANGSPEPGVPHPEPVSTKGSGSGRASSVSDLRTTTPLVGPERWGSRGTGAGEGGGGAGSTRPVHDHPIFDHRPPKSLRPRRYLKLDPYR